MPSDQARDAFDQPKVAEILRRRFAEKWAGAAGSTWNRNLAAIRSACTYWRSQHWITGDPLAGLERAKPPRLDRHADTGRYPFALPVVAHPGAARRARSGPRGDVPGRRQRHRQVHPGRSPCRGHGVQRRRRLAILPIRLGHPRRGDRLLPMVGAVTHDPEGTRMRDVWLLFGSDLGQNG